MLSVSLPSQLRGRNTGPKAFTLVEILVVLAILAVLAAMTYPVFQFVRERSRQTACTSNLQQLYKAFAMYAQDHDGRTPPYSNNMDYCMGNVSGKPTYRLRQRGAELVAVLLPYTKSKAIWFCPSDPLAHTAETTARIRHDIASYRTYQFRGVPFYEQNWPIPLSGILYRGQGTDSNGQAIGYLLTDQSWTSDTDGVIDWTGTASGPVAVNRFAPHLYDHVGSHIDLFFDGHAKAKLYTSWTDTIPVMDCSTAETIFDVP